jgi:hypothetical protein
MPTPPKRENHVAAQALLFSYYNFCRVHMSPGTTPAVEQALTSRVWSVQELVERAVPITSNAAS